MISLIKKTTKYLLFAFFLVPLFHGIILADSSAKTNPFKKDSKGPVNITSNEMVSYDNGLKIVFQGEVVTKRDNMTIYSDILEVYNNKKKNKIMKIIALNNVRIEKNGKNALGEKAVYFEDKNMVELTGNVVAWEEKNKITGDKIHFFIDKDVIKVFGNKKEKVNVTFYPEDKEKK